jgi:small subunit ribosomal protein S18
MKRDFFKRRKKVCYFCKEGIHFVDYKDENFLKKFISEKGKIRSRRSTGNCAKHQRILAAAIKRARHIAILPYVVQK